MAKKITRNDVPSAEDLCNPFVYVLKSGRARTFASVETDIARLLDLDPDIKNYRISGSKTTLYSNRVKDARALLRKRGLVELKGKDKVVLTAEGKAAAAELAMVFGKPEEETDTVEDTAADETPESTESTGDEDQELTLEPLTLFPIDAQIEEAAPTAAEIVPVVAYEVVSADGQPDAGSDPSGAKRSFGATIKGLPGKAKAGIGGGIAAAAIAIALIAGGGADMAKGDLTFLVETDGKVTAEQVVVHVEGTTDGNETVDTYYRSNPGTTYASELEPGEYTFTVDKSSLTDGDNVYTTDKVKVRYTGHEDITASIDLELDEEATATKIKEREEAEAKAKAEKARQEAEAKAAAEAKAKEEAEAKARAEAEAEAARAQESTRSIPQEEQSQATNEYTYVGNRNSKKFHYPWCSSVDAMKESNKVSLSSRDEAIGLGYEPCKNCNP